MIYDMICDSVYNYSLYMYMYLLTVCAVYVVYVVYDMAYGMIDV